MFSEAEISDDKFLCGELNLLQPIKGYRAATDPVLLAASCPAEQGQSVLDVGCGVGAAALCLGWRIPGLTLAGLELQPAYAELARRNAVRNGIDLSVHSGDLMSVPQELRRDFDHVITNPPYYSSRGTPSPLDARAAAMQVRVPLSEWVAACGRRLRPGGWLTLICGADGLPEVLAGMGDKLGSVAVLPLQPRQLKPAVRVLVRARKGGKAAFKLLSPFIIHQGLTHGGDRESYTTDANAVLRRGGSLSAYFS